MDLIGRCSTATTTEGCETVAVCATDSTTTTITTTHDEDKGDDEDKSSNRNDDDDEEATDDVVKDTDNANNDNKDEVTAATVLEKASDDDKEKDGVGNETAERCCYNSYKANWECGQGPTMKDGDSLCQEESSKGSRDADGDDNDDGRLKNGCSSSSRSSTSNNINNGDDGEEDIRADEIKEELDNMEYSVDGWCDLGPSAHAQGHSSPAPNDLELDEKEEFKLSPRTPPLVPDESKIRDALTRTRQDISKPTTTTSTSKENDRMPTPPDTTSRRSILTNSQTENTIVTISQLADHIETKDLPPPPPPAPAEACSDSGELDKARNKAVRVVPNEDGDKDAIGKDDTSTSEENPFSSSKRYKTSECDDDEDDCDDDISSSLELGKGVKNNRNTSTSTKRKIADVEMIESQPINDDSSTIITATGELAAHDPYQYQQSRGCTTTQKTMASILTRPSSNSVPGPSADANSHYHCVLSSSSSSSPLKTSPSSSSTSHPHSHHSHHPHPHHTRTTSTTTTPEQQHRDEDNDYNNANNNPNPNTNASPSLLVDIQQPLMYNMTPPSPAALVNTSHGGSYTYNNNNNSTNTNNNTSPAIITYPLHPNESSTTTTTTTTATTTVPLLPQTIGQFLEVQQHQHQQHQPYQVTTPTNMAHVSYNSNNNVCFGGYGNNALFNRVGFPQNTFGYFRFPPPILQNNGNNAIINSNSNSILNGIFPPHSFLFQQLPYVPMFHQACPFPSGGPPQIRFVAEQGGTTTATCAAATTTTMHSSNGRDDSNCSRSNSLVDLSLTNKRRKTMERKSFIEIDRKEVASKTTRTGTERMDVLVESLEEADGKISNGKETMMDSTHYELPQDLHRRMDETDDGANPGDNILLESRGGGNSIETNELRRAITINEIPGGSGLVCGADENDTKLTVGNGDTAAALQRNHAAKVKEGEKTKTKIEKTKFSKVAGKGDNFVDPTRIKLGHDDDEMDDSDDANDKIADDTSDEDWVPQGRDNRRMVGEAQRNQKYTSSEKKNSKETHSNVEASCAARNKRLGNGSKRSGRRGKPSASGMQCQDCGKIFHGSYHLKRHLQSHTENRPYHCLTCGKSFKQKAHLHGHETVHLRERNRTKQSKSTSGSSSNCPQEAKSNASPSKCPGRPKKVYSQNELSCSICSKVFKTLYRLKRHVQSHTDIRPYTCCVCGKGFKQTGHRNEHELNHEKNRRKFLCNMCGVIFRCRSSFNNHLKTHRFSNKDSTLGDKDNKGSTTTTNANNQTNTKCKMAADGENEDEMPQTGYDCPYCTDKFATAQGLNRHLESHSEVDQRLHVQPYSCQVCCRSFTYKHNLVKHMLTHQAPEKYAEFHKSRLEEHLASGKPSYTCPVCFKVFIRKETLAKHSKIHTGTKPFKCLVCHKEFTQNVHMKVHMRKHTGNRPFQCKKCNRGFIDSTALAKHIEYEACNSENMLFHCVICDKRHYYLGSIKQHIKKEHNENDVDKFISRTHRQRRQRLANMKKDNACRICSTSFTEKGNLIRHIKRKHGDLLKILDEERNQRSATGSVARTDGVVGWAESRRNLDLENDTRPLLRLANESARSEGNDFRGISSDKDDEHTATFKGNESESCLPICNSNCTLSETHHHAVMLKTNATSTIESNAASSERSKSPVLEDGGIKRSQSSELVVTVRQELTTNGVAAQTMSSEVSDNVTTDWTTSLHRNDDDDDEGDDVSDTFLKPSEHEEEEVVATRRFSPPPPKDSRNEEDGVVIKDEQAKQQQQHDEMVISTTEDHRHDANEPDGHTNNSNSSGSNTTSVSSFLYHVGLVEKAKATTTTTNVGGLGGSHHHRHHHHHLGNGGANSSAILGGAVTSMESDGSTSMVYDNPWLVNHDLPHHHHSHRHSNTTTMTMYDAIYKDRASPESMCRNNLEVFCDLALMTERKSVRSASETSGFSSTSSTCGGGGGGFGSKSKSKPASSFSSSSPSSVLNDLQDSGYTQQQQQAQGTSTTTTLSRHEQRSTEEVYSEFGPWLEQLMGNPTTNRTRVCLTDRSSPTDITPVFLNNYSPPVSNDTNTNNTDMYCDDKASPALGYHHDNMKPIDLSMNDRTSSYSSNDKKAIPIPDHPAISTDTARLRGELYGVNDIHIQHAETCTTTTTNSFGGLDHDNDNNMRKMSPFPNSPKSAVTTYSSSSGDINVFFPMMNLDDQNAHTTSTTADIKTNSSSSFMSRIRTDTSPAAIDASMTLTSIAGGKEASVQTPLCINPLAYRAAAIPRSITTNNNSSNSKAPSCKPPRNERKNHILHSLLGGSTTPCSSSSRKSPSHDNDDENEHYDDDDDDAGDYDDDNEDDMDDNVIYPTHTEDKTTTTAASASVSTPTTTSMTADDAFLHKLLSQNASFIPLDPMEPLASCHVTKDRSSKVKDRGPFSCLGCGKCFNARHQLKRHEMTHSEIRPYRCSECGKAFRQKVHLSDHLKRHRGQRPFLCQACGKRFVLKNELKQHIKNYCRVNGNVKVEDGGTTMTTTTCNSNSNNNNDNCSGGGGSSIGGGGDCNGDKG